MSVSNNKLWTKNFTIITVGSAISLFGTTVFTFAIGLLVLDFTGSAFLYSLFLLLVTSPKLIIPLIAGPFIDRFSRRRIVYMVDYIYAVLYLIVALIIFSGYFNFALYAFVGIIFGTLDSIYQVSYDSFYPNLISEGNYSKAYSVSSLLYPLASTIMLPFASFAYETIGIGVLFLINSATFIVTATIETQIKVDEKHTQKDGHISVAIMRDRFKSDFKDGLVYLKSDKGLLSITTYFFITLFAGAAYSTLALPFFKSTPGLGVTNYSYLMSIATVGRMVGGLFHYFYKFKPQRKFSIAIFVYISISCFYAGILYSPLFVMFILEFLNGAFSVTSYNIRISSTQNYIPDEKRGRFNGIFLMITTLGTAVGQLTSGFLAEYMAIPDIVLVFMIINAVAALLIMLKNKKHVKKIYNAKF